MKTYIGTKFVQAKPMTRGEYNKFRGWPLPADENAADEGYVLTYKDGYVSWSPKEAFEEAYREVGEMMDFGGAIRALRAGCKTARAGWNGKKQYVEMATCISYKGSTGNVVNVEHNNIGNKALAFVGTSGVQMGWLASQADMLADDWYIVED